MTHAWGIATKRPTGVTSREIPLGNMEFVSFISFYLFRGHSVNRWKGLCNWNAHYLRKKLLGCMVCRAHGLYQCFTHAGYINCISSQSTRAGGREGKWFGACRFIGRDITPSQLQRTHLSPQHSTLITWFLQSKYLKKMHLQKLYETQPDTITCPSPHNSLLRDNSASTYVTIRTEDIKKVIEGCW